jgi:hypothetical protein
MKISKAGALEILNDKTIHEEYQDGPYDLGMGVRFSTVFKHDGKLFSFDFVEMPATSIEIEGEVVECFEVEALRKLVTHYTPVYGKSEDSVKTIRFILSMHRNEWREAVKREQDRADCRSWYEQNKARVSGTIGQRDQQEAR